MQGCPPPPPQHTHTKCMVSILLLMLQCTCRLVVRGNRHYNGSACSLLISIFPIQYELCACNCCFRSFWPSAAVYTLNVMTTECMGQQYNYTVVCKRGVYTDSSACQYYNYTAVVLHIFCAAQDYAEKFSFGCANTMGNSTAKT